VQAPASTSTSRQENGATTTTTTARNENGATTTTTTGKPAATTSRDDGATTTSSARDGTTSTSRNENGTTSTSRNENGTTSTSRNENGTTSTSKSPESTTSSSRDGTSSTSRTTSTSRNEQTTTSRKEETTSTSRNDNGGTTSTSRKDETTSTSRDGTTSTSRKEETTSTSRNDNGYTTTSTRTISTGTHKEEPASTTTRRDDDTKETTRSGETKETTTSRGGDKETTTSRGGDKETTTSRGEDKETTTTRREGNDATKPVVDEKREDFKAAADAAAKCRIVGSADCDDDFAKARQELIDAAKKANDERAATRAADRTRVDDLARDINTKAPDAVCKVFTDNAAPCLKECTFTNDSDKAARFGAALKCVSDEKEKELRDAGADATKENKDQTRTELKEALQAGVALLPEKQRQDAQKGIDQCSVAEEKRTERDVSLIEINAKVSRAKATVDDKTSTPAERNEARKTLEEVKEDAAKKAAVDRLPGNRPNVCGKLLDGAASNKATKAGETDKSKFISSVRVLHVKIDVPEDKIEWVRTEARKIDASAEVEKSDSERLTKNTDEKAAVDTKSKKKRGTASCEVFVPVDVADYDIASTKVSTTVAEAGGSVTGVSSIGQADVEAAKPVVVTPGTDVIGGAATLVLSAAMAVVSIVAALV
jgi:hypothetical protein